MIIMMDTIGTNVSNIPTTAQKVAGYVTGSGVVPWSASAWARFPNAGHVRIKQNPGNSDILTSDVIDVESQAATPDDVVTYVHTRINAGIHWSTIYGTLDTINQCRAQLTSHLGAAFIGHVDCWLANWNLNQSRATALLGTNIVSNIPCRAVQWASPSSNPHTLVPGTDVTLSHANVDLSVTQDAWYAHGETWNRK